MAWSTLFTASSSAARALYLPTLAGLSVLSRYATLWSHLFQCLLFAQLTWLLLKRQEAQTGVISLEHDDPGAVKAMLEFMYHGSYTHADEDTAMLFVARAYAIGDIYCVPELKDHAAAQFEELASARWDTPDFAHAMRIIYESIPEKGRGIMRDIVVHVAAQHHEVLLRVPEFQDTLDAFGVLGKDLLQALSNQLVDPPNVCISP